MKSKIALTIGDAAGIGPEISVKVAADKSITDIMDIVLVGPESVVEKAVKKYCPDKNIEKYKDGSTRPNCIYFDDFDCLTFNGSLNAKASTAEAGKVAYEGVSLAAKAVLLGEYDAIVTAPVSKESVNLAGIEFQGHTELVAEICNIDNFCMMQSDGPLRVAFATCHIPLMDVKKNLSKEKILKTIVLLNDAAKADGVENPQIALAGVNPHAGEAGYMGREEIDLVIPAMKEAEKLEISVHGPFPADTLFVESIRKKFDGIVSMYHDQGHIPFKMLAFDRGVNSTLGLPIIRTSVDHGTAFDIAWQGIADTGSLKQALITADNRVKMKKATGQ
ncbi:MAG: 4-hydroxythreonine-4-phosphate dehydrogenase PdxA [Lentisphaeraceae bacterium]|nr:4-hydroxythreonine-4-phosphate dehydrogenase PdxA [Lentisphaeraceae bacterium]